MYTPKPINTDGVVLSDDLLALTEKIAENVHDVWAQNRIEQGWIYGENSDDNFKTSPCLLPYSELPDNEKIYDRETALSTLKLSVALGYKIEKK